MEKEWYGRRMEEGWQEDGGGLEGRMCLRRDSKEWKRISEGRTRDGGGARKNGQGSKKGGKEFRKTGMGKNGRTIRKW
jgi:hypothetical protein